MSINRRDALDFTKTAFGLSTGRIREDLGDVLSVSNALLAFQRLPELVASGFIGQPSEDLTQRGDYKTLNTHVERAPEGRVKAYVEELNPDALEIAANCAETFFTVLVKDPKVIPMSSNDKTEVIRKMASAPTYTRRH
jgi:hypothetical protein